MMTGFERALGKLEGLVEALAEKVEQQGVESSAQRRVTYEAVDSIKNSVSSIDHRIKVLEKTVSDISPETREFTQWRLRAEGAGMLGKVLWVMGGILLSAAAWASGALQWLTGK